MKPMRLVQEGRRLDLLIERDAGNGILILMGGKSQFDDWLNLRNLCDSALDLIRAGALDKGRYSRKGVRR